MRQTNINVDLIQAVQSMYGKCRSRIRRQGSECWRLPKNTRKDRTKNLISSITAQTWNQHFEQMSTENWTEFILPEGRNRKYVSK